MSEFISDHAETFAIFLVSVLGGFVLGLRFRVLVLLPVMSVCIVAIVLAGIGLRAAAWPIAIAAVVHAVGLQIGYLVGICIAFVLPPQYGGNSSGRLKPLSRLDRAAPLRRTTGAPPSSSDKP